MKRHRTRSLRILERGQLPLIERDSCQPALENLCAIHIEERDSGRIYQCGDTRFARQVRDVAARSDYANSSLSRQPARHEPPRRGNYRCEASGVPGSQHIETARDIIRESGANDGDILRRSSFIDALFLIGARVSRKEDL